MPLAAFGARCVLTVCLVLCLCGAARDDDELEYDIDIPQLNVDEALNTLAQQTGVQLLFPFDLVKTLGANPVEGRYTLMEALEIILQDTGLSGGLTESGVITISRLASNDSPGREQMSQRNDDKNKKAGFAAFLAGLFSVSAGAQEPADTDEAEPRLEEIVVVGTNIRGVEAVGVDVITMDREYIEISGISNTTELIQSVPQNFGLGNEAVEMAGVIRNEGDNLAFSSSVDLRGLGSDSTLMLLNGRRSASGGGAGNFVDLNTIPTAAIERIEVLPDGASAIYGSDAIGGVVNVVLRDDYEGAETSVRYAPGTSDIDEIQFSQVFGKKWDSGNFLFTYEYYDRSELNNSDRVYTRDSDLTSLGGGNRSIPRSNPGNIYHPFTFQYAFAIPPGQDGTVLTPADLIDVDPVTGDPTAINLQNSREGGYVLPEQERHSVFVSASQSLSNTVDLFAEFRYSTRDYEFLNQRFGNSFMAVPDTNPFFVDPFGGLGAFVCPFLGVNGNCLIMDYDTAADYGPPRSKGDLEAVAGVLGATFSLSDTWDLEVYGSYGTEDTFQRVDRVANFILLGAALADPDPATAFNPFGDGSFTNPATLAAIEGFQDANVESELKTVNVRLDGELFDLSGGPAKLAVGVEFRDQTLASNRIDFLFAAAPSPGTARLIFGLDRDVSAAFAEIYLPFVTEQNSRPGIKKLEISIAGRYEDYSDFGDSLDPKLGVTWSPVDSLSIRGSIGTSFRAPLLTELNTSNNRILADNLADPLSPTGITTVVAHLGNVPGLIPEEGTTWTAGFDVTPNSLQGLKFGFTYFSTEVENLIQRPVTLVTAVLLDPIANEPVITRVDPMNNPEDLADVTALLNDPTCTNPSCAATPPDSVGAIVDLRIQNAAKVELAGLDFNVAYAFETAAGAFNLSFYSSHLFEFEEQLVAGPVVDNVDTIAKPNSLNLRGSLAWNAGGMNAAVIGKHVGDYTDDIGSPECAATPCPIGSWTRWDLQLGYDFSDRFSGFLDGTKLSLSVRNVFDEDPPFVDIAEIGVGFDAINANPLGRFAAIQLTKTW